MSETRTIKIRTSTYRRLKVLAAEAGVGLMDLVERLVSEFEGKRAETRAVTPSTAAEAPSDAEDAHPL